MRSPKITHPGPTSSIAAYWVGRVWMTVFGWSTGGDAPKVERAVFIAAPHTSNWDLPHMLAAAFVFRLKISFLAKHTLFRWPLGGLLRWLGGIPVDRRAPRGLVDQVVDRISAADRILVIVPPSGTRSRRDYWKSGFYWMARNAGVPIVCGTLDYSRRIASLGTIVEPTEDVEADMDAIRAYYTDKRGKFSKNETRVRIKEEDGHGRVATPPKAAASS
jgi:1-acyl-sn-glycerol-3-phosphate acyltransferase